MSTPWFASHADPKATGGGASPDPVTEANTNWTWDVEFDPVNQSLYARASLCSFTNIGGDSGWVSGGIVQYRTRKNGVDTVHHVGLSGHAGIADFMWDSNVDSVTFGWMIEGDDIVEGGIKFRDLEMTGGYGMHGQYLEGRPISDEASSVCVLFDPKDGRIAHVHGITMLHSRGGITESELEARARKHAEDFGKSVTGLKALHVPMAVFRQNGTYRVNAQGDGLIPSPPRSKRNR